MGANKTLTCLEALEQGFSFVKTCSGCDYYSMNHKINLIAMKKPRSELSRYWQCCAPHKYGELTSSYAMKTPYRPPNDSKYNVLVASDRGVNPSSTKRVRLFTPSSSGNDRDEIMPNRALESYLLGAEKERAVAECAVAKAERDKAVVERDSAIEARDAAKAERDMAIREMHEAIAARDRAFTESNAAKAERDLANNTVAELRDAMLRLQNQVDDGVNNCQHLIQEKATNQSSLRAMHLRQTELSNRVAYLESVYRDKSTLLVSQKANKNKLALIQKFARLLSPDAEKKRQLCIIFDELYDKKKYFKKYVRNRLKEEMRGLIRLETCREIKKHFAPWRILEVMDCSQQSLNQVSKYVICYELFCKILLTRLPSFYRNAIKLYIVFRKRSRSGQKSYLKLNAFDRRRSNLIITLPTSFPLSIHQITKQVGLTTVTFLITCWQRMGC